MQELLNLEERQKEYLSMLQRGQCIVRVNSIEKPFVLRTPNIERSWLTDEEISENNNKILEKKFFSLKNKIYKKKEEFIMERLKSNCKVCKTSSSKPKNSDPLKSSTDYCGKIFREVFNLDQPYSRRL